MRFLPTRAHGVLDYLVGLLLVASPWLFGFADGPAAARGAPIALGAGALLYSLLTDYELGLLRVVPMPGHLLLDAGARAPAIPGPVTPAAPSPAGGRIARTTARASTTGCPP
jgi:hypothetical protein